MNPEIFQIGGSWLTTAIVWLLIIVAAVLLFTYRTPMRSFGSEILTELRKASWPWDPKEKGVKKYKELIDSTTIVVIAMLLLAGYVAFWDFLMVNIVGLMTK